MPMQNYGTVPSRNRAVNAERRKPRGLVNRAMSRKKRRARRPKR